MMMAMRSANTTAPMMMAHTIMVWAMSSPELGADVGGVVGSGVVGRDDGEVEGQREGSGVGIDVGLEVGNEVGSIVGDGTGAGLGWNDGAGLGGVVGVSVGAGVGENVSTETESTDASDIARRRRPPPSRPAEAERRRSPSCVANVTIALVKLPVETDLLSTSTTYACAEMLWPYMVVP